MQNSELIPGLPEELGLECLTRVHYSAHRVATRVCRRWRSLFRSQEFYDQRRKSGRTRKLACLVLKNPEIMIRTSAVDSAKSAPSFGLVVFDPAEMSWTRVDPVPVYQDGLPLFCRVVGCGGKLVVLGGWDPASYDPVTDVFVYDFVESRWARGRSMPRKVSFFAAAGSGSGCVYVAGGHDKDKHALRDAWRYDVGRDEWAELGPMGRERDECEGFVLGWEFWVVSGYGTEEQGRFEAGAEVYHPGSGAWRRVEGAWEEGRCPSECARGIWREDEERVPSWGEWVRGGVVLGDRALVVGSGHEYYLVELKEGGHFGKFEKISVPREFSGPFQASCCVEM